MIARALSTSLALALAVFLFVQPGLLGAGVNDEAEHLHAAWLMAEFLFLVLPPLVQAWPGTTPG